MNRLRIYKPQANSMFPYQLKDEEIATKLDSIHKLGQLEDIEEELGVDLITLFKVVKQQKIWTKYDGEIDCCDECNYMLLEDFIYFYWNSGKHLVFLLSEYGKTWALTKEELYNE